MAELIDKVKLVEAMVLSHTAHANNTREESLLNRDVRIVMEQPTTSESEIRAKAIDEFAEKLKWELGQLIFPDSEKFAHSIKEQEQICHQNMTLKRAIRLVDYFADQLKEEY